MKRGYFGVGVQGISKEGNIGNLLRTTHAFGGSFFFTISPGLDVEGFRVSDTSGAFDHMPYYEYARVGDLMLPGGCALVGVELTGESIALPSFRHPTRAAYVLGPEMGSLSPELTAQCDFVIKIPMKFCVNVGVAGAIVLYDRLISNNRFPDRPVKMGGPDTGAMLPVPEHRTVPFTRRKTRLPE